MEIITTVLDRLSNNKTLFTIFGLFIAIDIGLNIGVKIGLYEAVILNQFDSKSWFYIILGILIFWAFNSLIARYTLLLIQFLILVVFKNSGNDRDAEYYTQSELLNDAIKYNNPIAEKVYYDNAEKGNNIHQTKDIVFSLLVFIAVDFFYDHSLINIIHWEGIWAGLLVIVMIGCFVFICIPYDKDYMDISLKKEMHKKGFSTTEKEKLMG